jgi:hypothetical protein
MRRREIFSLCPSCNSSVPWEPVLIKNPGTRQADQRVCVLCDQPIRSDDDAITIRANQPAHRHCYEDAVKKGKPELD